MSTDTSRVTGALSSADLKTFQASIETNPAFLSAMNAVSTTPVNKVAVNRRTASKVDNSFSIHLPENPVTSQKSSGRCWMFAALNTFRYFAQAKMNLKEGFEFSQNYTLFFDKLEKANYFLESILQTLDVPVGSRLLDHLLSNPLQDGGQWDMFVNLMQKYGVVPKSVMPETESSSSTGQMCYQLTTVLRDGAAKLRSKADQGASESALRGIKDELISTIYRMLCIHLGEPPTSFEWQYRDKDRKFVRRGKISPQEFFKEYIGLNLDEYVCLIHDPRPGHSFNANYTVKFLGNVIEGRATEYINADLETIKSAAIAQLKDNDAVWFGCDVGKFLDRDSGVMDTNYFNYDLVYGVAPTFSKAERLMYCQSLMTHAMVFTGVNLNEAGKPTKWRVENSWSDSPGDKGFFQMSDEWFDEYMYEVVVHEKYVPEATKAARKLKPIELEPWDPMGSLA